MHVEGGVAESVMEGSTDPGIARLGTNDSDKAAEFLCLFVLCPPYASERVSL